MAKCRCLSRDHAPHDSAMEALDCNRLLADMQAGKNGGFETQPAVPLHVAGKVWKHWKIDFKVYSPDRTFFWYHETKGFNRSNGAYLLKLAAFLTEYPHIPIFINWRRAQLTESLRIIYEKIPGVKPAGKKKARISGRGLVRNYVKGKGWVTVRADSLTRPKRV